MIDAAIRLVAHHALFKPMGRSTRCVRPIGAPGRVPWTIEQFIHSGVVRVDRLLCGRRGYRRSEHTRTVTVPIARAQEKPFRANARGLLTDRPRITAAGQILNRPLSWVGISLRAPDEARPGML